MPGHPSVSLLSMEGAEAWTVIRPDQFTFTPPSRGDQSRGVMRLSDCLRESRANLWRMPPSSKGRRHRETMQEEIFVSIAGTATLQLGDPPTQWSSRRAPSQS